MILLDKLTEMVDSQQAANECFAEYKVAYLSGLLKKSNRSEGSLSAHDALQIYKIREQTTREARKWTGGFTITLERLSLRPANEVVILKHLNTSQKLFTFFISESGDELIGCICVEKKRSVSSWRRPSSRS